MPAPSSRAPAAAHGRIFEGSVTKKFPTRVVVEFERTVYVPKYQRFTKKKTRLHARINPSIAVAVGDYVRVQECRPLSKIIHFIVIANSTSSRNLLDGKFGAKGNGTNQISRIENVRPADSPAAKAGGKQ